MIIKTWNVLNYANKGYTNFVENLTNINKTNNHLSQTIEHKQNTTYANENQCPDIEQPKHAAGLNQSIGFQASHFNN